MFPFQRGDLKKGCDVVCVLDDIIKAIGFTLIDSRTFLADGVELNLIGLTRLSRRIEITIMMHVGIID